MLTWADSRVQDDWLRALQRLDLRLLCAWALSAARKGDATLPTGLASATEQAPRWAAEQAVLQLALEAAQRPEGAQLLAGQGFWEHIQVRYHRLGQGQG